VEEHLVRETFSYVTRQVTEDDKAISSEVNRLILAVIARAHRALRHGPPAEREIVMRYGLNAAGKRASVDVKAEVEQSRRVFLEELRQMTEITAAEPEVTASGITTVPSHASPPPPLPPEPLDQDHQA
jgi:hypothetical protein